MTNTLAQGDVERPVPTRSRISSYARLLLFLGLVLAVGFAIGFLNAPGPWYSTLTKPPFNPPNYVFAPVWSVMYVLIAIAGWRVWERRNDTTGRTLWMCQMVLNFTWSPMFFSVHSPTGALVVIAALLLSVLAFLAHEWSRDRLSFLLFAPYAAWVAFATLLNASIVVLNA